MSKHFWLIDKKTKTTGYCINSYGALNMLDLKRYEVLWLNYNEINEILSLKTKQERYNLCDKLFKQKFPQQGKDKKELSREEKSKLEKLFS